ncbi:trypco2 family protein [Streptomyces sp. NPDC002935]|uniref:trypco2 family protein n=1 Tax=Streptomyces sp. NPDC002935 TaxID=3154545 RepID=UPI0033A5BF99
MAQILRLCQELKKMWFSRGKPDDGPAEVSVELVAAVRALRAQITEAAASDPDSDLRFQMGPIQLEFTVALTRDRTAKGGIKAWVVTADAERKRSMAHTHRVTLNLTPVSAATGESPEIRNTESGHRIVR